MTVYSNTISKTLPPGESERWVVDTATHRAVRASIEADGSPYEVDMQTGEQNDFTTYTSVLPFGAVEFTDTDEHVIGTDTTDDAVYVSVENTSGSELHVEGDIDKHSREATSTTTDFLTRGTGNRGLSFLDGRLLADTQVAAVREMASAMDLAGNDITDAGKMIWDASAGEIPSTNFGPPAGDIQNYPLVLGTDTGTNLDGNDLTDNGTSVWDSSLAALVADVEATNVSGGSVSASDELVVPSYATLSDVPNDLSAPGVVYVESENAFFAEDGT